MFRKQGLQSLSQQAKEGPVGLVGAHQSHEKRQSAQPSSSHEIHLSLHADVHVLQRQAVQRRVDVRDPLPVGPLDPDRIPRLHGRHHRTSVPQVLLPLQGDVAPRGDGGRNDVGIQDLLGHRDLLPLAGRDDLHAGGVGVVTEDDVGLGGREVEAGVDGELASEDVVESLVDFDLVEGVRGPRCPHKLQPQSPISVLSPQGQIRPFHLLRRQIHVGPRAQSPPPHVLRHGPVRRFRE
mmetsp:Transcript_35474/g.72597  ORF Transcript_35474/g.72597 Transcript_35474/m.72597 type:complete len:237 (-) Transcript_35474:337-1047(-)